MRYTSEITCDGPYLRVLLPDVLPPDWAKLRDELELEVDEGVTRVVLVVGQCASFGSHDPALSNVVGWLQAQGVNALVVSQDGS